MQSRRLFRLRDGEKAVCEGTKGQKRPRDNPKKAKHVDCQRIFR